MSKRIICFGKFEEIHSGHLNYLVNSKLEGFDLIVGVHKDSKRSMIDRLNVVKMLRCVDGVFSYDDEYQEMVEKYGAEFVALGEEHRGKERFKEIKVPILWMPRTPDISSTQIKELFAWDAIWAKQAEYYKHDYNTIANYLDHKLELNRELKHFSILDYGCGTGQLLHQYGGTTIGIDVSQKALDEAKKSNIRSTLYIKSNEIPITGNVSCIISIGVFQYLPSYTYAEKIIKQMKDLSSKILILGIPDINFKCFRDSHRAQLDPEHLYYERGWFKEKGFEIITSQDYPQCANLQKYEFGAVIK